MNRLHKSVASILAALTFTLTSPLSATDKSSPVVVELFTSQSCYSCPPAEQYLGELAGDPDIVALEWHVDYWDNLVYGAAGRWKDPFSDPAFTERQGDYNRDIRRSRSIYTPQMIIDGRLEAVGSRRNAVQLAIAEASRDDKAASVIVTPGGENRLSVVVDGEPREPATIWLVSYLGERTTDVPRGENHGKRLVNHNIVRSMTKLADWDGGKLELTIDPPAPGLECVVLVQRSPVGRIDGVGRCDQSPGA